MNDRYEKMIESQEICIKTYPMSGFGRVTDKREEEIELGIDRQNWFDCQYNSTLY